MWNPKNKTNKQNKTDTENKLVAAREEGVWERREIGEGY